jgi:hypothetical protein
MNQLAIINCIILGRKTPKFRFKNANDDQKDMTTQNSS